MTEQQKKFDEAGNSNFNNLVSIENAIKKELKTAEESIQNSITEEIKQAFTQYPMEKEVNRTPPQMNLKSAMFEARNDEKVELSEKQRRERNFIIHGALEVGKSPEEKKKQDEEYIKEVLTKIRVNAVPVSITRLGDNKESKHRPIKITMKSKTSVD